MSKFHERLAKLGFATYEEYLDSDHWMEFKKRYREARLPIRCVVCKSPHIQLHHHTYARLGCERLEDVTPLCREHHVAVHEWLRTSGRIVVEYTRDAVHALKSQRPPRRKKGKRRRGKRPWIEFPRCPRCRGRMERGSELCYDCFSRV